MTIVGSNDPRILTVEVTDDLITAHLADGRTISVPLPLQRNARTSRLSGLGKGCTGRTWMRTSVLSACSPVLLLLHRSKRRRDKRTWKWETGGRRVRS